MKSSERQENADQPYHAATQALRDILYPEENPRYAFNEAMETLGDFRAFLVVELRALQRKLTSKHLIGSNGPSIDELSHQACKNSKVKKFFKNFRKEWRSAANALRTLQTLVTENGDLRKIIGTKNIDPSIFLNELYSYNEWFSGDPTQPDPIREFEAVIFSRQRAKNPRPSQMNQSYLPLTDSTNSINTASPLLMFGQTPAANNTPSAESQRHREVEPPAP